MNKTLVETLVMVALTCCALWATTYDDLKGVMQVVSLPVDAIVTIFDAFAQVFSPAELFVLNVALWILLCLSCQIRGV